MDTKSQKTSGEKDSNWLYLFVSVIPPFIFMFHLYTKNAGWIDYWHVLILTLIFAAGGGLFYALVSRLWKSPQGGALACVFVWVLFFNISALYQFSGLNTLILIRWLRRLIVLILVMALTVSVFFLGRRLRKREIFQILAVFEMAIFLLNVVPATALFISKATSDDSDADYKTSFTINPGIISGSPSPNIYWLHMDGMLGFEAVEHFFNDPQTNFETQLTERGFIVNRNAEFEAGHGTARAVPALMCPFFYDTTMLPLLTSIDLGDYIKKEQALLKLSFPLYRAQWNNELIAAFAAKSYQTNIIGNPSIYFHAAADNLYVSNGKIEKNISTPINAALLYQVDRFINLTELTLLTLFTQNIRNRIYALSMKSPIVPIQALDRASIKSMYGEVFRDEDAWYVNALTDIFAGSGPRLTIINDLKTHGPFLLDDDGTRVHRTEEEGLNIYNYPPQHRFTRKYLVAIIDIILMNDPDAVIVVEADHGLHMVPVDKILAMPGGSADTVRLIYNQTMSAVRIPEKWGGLDAPLDPLNITRELVNRYVGENYNLLETHP